MYALDSTSIALYVGFLLVERFWTIEPIFPLHLLANREVVTSYLIARLQVAGQTAVSEVSDLRHCLLF
jgi:hypothetical protein